MTNEANAFGVNVAACPQYRQGCFRIGDEIGDQGRHLAIGARLHVVPVVTAQDRDAFAREMIGEDEERLVSKQSFVAVLRARA